MHSASTPARQHASTCASLVAISLLFFTAFNLLAAEITKAEAAKMSEAQRKALYKWVTGEPFVYDGWSKEDGGYSPNLWWWRPEYYAVINTREWGDAPAWEDLPDDGDLNGPFFGIFETTKAPAMPGSLAWKQWAKAGGGNGHWYALSETKGTWTEMKLAAEKYGAHLVTITSVEENAFLGKTFLTNISYAWIGLSRKNDGGGGGGDVRPAHHIHRVNLRRPTKCDICDSILVTPAQARADLRTPTAR